MNTKIAMTIRINPRMFQIYVQLSPTILNEFAIVVPADARIPMKMMIEVPFPMPYSVILSLSHMTITLPATKRTIVSAIVRIALS